jgi:hypothetical protein
MSLLGSQVYANPDTPLWLAASGNATTTGNILASRVAATKQFGGLGTIVLTDASNNTVGGFNQVATVAPFSDLYIVSQSGQKIQFGTIGGGGGNSFITPSTTGANADLLSVGGTVSARNLDLLDTGAAAVIGTATLTSGTVTVNTTACDVTSYIMLSRTAVNASTAVGELRVSNQGANNFTVVSATPATPGTTLTTDVSTFHWMIVNAA